MKKSKARLNTKNKILAVIVAKKKSTRLFNKNLKLFCGKPLIYWGILAAKKSKKIQDVMISSDSKKILSLSKRFHKKIIIRKRPKKLSSNSISSLEVIKDAINFLKKSGRNYSHVALIQVTSPLRSHKHIDEAIKIMNKKNLSGIVGITKTECPKIWTTYIKPKSMKDFMTENKYLKKLYNNKKSNISYKINGAIYVISLNKLYAKNPFYSDKIGTYLMSRKHSIDIDTPFDFQIGELLKKNIKL